MKNFFFLTLFICTFVSACRADDLPEGKDGTESALKEEAPAKKTLKEEIYERAKKRKRGEEPTKLDLLNELAAKGAEEIEGKGPELPPRQISRAGQRPEIIIVGDVIKIDGVDFKMRSPIDQWKKILGPNYRRDLNRITAYTWDGLGVQLLTREQSKNVIEFQVFFNIEPPDPLRPDASRIHLPKKAFSGYFEIDGYGVDAQTEFQELRRMADPKRNIRCSLRDCSHPHGGFNDVASIYMRLDSSSDKGHIYEFSLSGSE